MSAKVLLVDDVTMFLALMKGFLRLSAVHLITAMDGVDALKLAREERPELIFMDLHMPNMDGADCCARLKADPELRKIPVIMITAEGKEEDRARCLAAGCNAFLTKPLDRNQFLATARQYLPTIDRRDKRVSCRTRVKFKLYGVTLSGDLLDLSAHGVYIATDYKVELEATIELVFALPDARGATIQAKGRVAWLNSKSAPTKKDMPAGFGVEFIAITEESQSALTAFIQQAG